MGVYGDTGILAAGRADGVHTALASACRGGILAATGTGVYTLTLDQACAAAERAVLITLGSSGVAKYDIASTTVITISTFAVDGTTATDKEFAVLVLRVTP